MMEFRGRWLVVARASTAVARANGALALGPVESRKRVVLEKAAQNFRG